LTTQLSRETLSDQVAKYLLLSISEKGLQPGDSLPSMASLMEEFSVSLPVIREALKSLSALGVITINKGKGAMVKPIDDQLLRVFFSQAIRLESEPLTRLMEVRQPLEIQSAMLAAHRHTGQDLFQLETLVADMAANLHQADHYIHLDAEFHLAIAIATHNLMLHYLVVSSRTALEDTMLTIREKREELGLIGNEQKAHETILAEIKRGDAAKAGAAMANHLTETLSLVEWIEHREETSNPLNSTRVVSG
jgi:GntR family transcriptional regulator, transcriptional repressor for pyruvate dehydrogenase complex